MRYQLTQEFRNKIDDYREKVIERREKAHDKDARRKPIWLLEANSRLRDKGLYKRDKAIQVFVYVVDNPNKTTAEIANAINMEGSRISPSLNEFVTNGIVVYSQPRYSLTQFGEDVWEEFQKLITESLDSSLEEFYGFKLGPFELYTLSFLFNNYKQNAAEAPELFSRMELALKRNPEKLWTKALEGKIVVTTHEKSMSSTKTNLRIRNNLEKVGFIEVKNKGSGGYPIKIRLTDKGKRFFLETTNILNRIRKNFVRYRNKLEESEGDSDLPKDIGHVDFLMYVWPGALEDMKYLEYFNMFSGDGKLAGELRMRKKTVKKVMSIWERYDLARRLSAYELTEDGKKWYKESFEPSWELFGKNARIMRQHFEPNIKKLEGETDESFNYRKERSLPEIIIHAMEHSPYPLTYTQIGRREGLLVKKGDGIVVSPNCKSVIEKLVELEIAEGVEEEFVISRIKQRADVMMSIFERIRDRKYTLEGLSNRLGFNKEDVDLYVKHMIDLGLIGLDPNENYYYMRGEGGGNAIKVYYERMTAQPETPEKGWEEELEKRLSVLACKGYLIEDSEDSNEEKLLELYLKLSKGEDEDIEIARVDLKLILEGSTTVELLARLLGRLIVMGKKK